jgi:hypothetical protein
MLTVDVLGLVGVDATNGKLSVGGLSGAITTRKIVDDQGGNLITRNVLDGILDHVDLCTSVASDYVRFTMVQTESCSTYIQKKVPTSATLVAAAARAESVMAAAATDTSDA